MRPGALCSDRAALAARRDRRVLQPELAAGNRDGTTADLDPFDAPARSLDQREQGARPTDLRPLRDLDLLAELDPTVAGEVAGERTRSRPGRRILGNAVASFTERMALILFTPMADRTHTIAVNPDIGVPDISFAEADLLPHIGDTLVERLDLVTAAQYGVETVYLLERP